METVRTLNVAAKCSIAVSQDMPKRAESGISIRLLCVPFPAKWLDDAGAENVNRAKWRSNYLNG